MSIVFLVTNQVNVVRVGVLRALFVAPQRIINKLKFIPASVNEFGLVYCVIYQSD